MKPEQSARKTRRSSSMSRSKPERNCQCNPGFMTRRGANCVVHIMPMYKGNNGETMQSLKITLLIMLCGLTINAQNKPEDKSIASKITGLQKIEGYIPLYWDAANGKMWMEIARFNTELLYQVSLPAGIGSNPIGLDRGQLGGTYVVYFE